MEAMSMAMPQINDLIGLMKKNNSAAHVACVLVQCFDVVWQRRCEIFIFEVLMTMRA